VAEIQKNRNFDIRFYNLFFKTSKLGVSENLYKANALGYIILKKTGQSSPKNDLFLEVKTGLLHFYFKKK
jgi:hypothetical protein